MIKNDKKALIGIALLLCLSVLIIVVATCIGSTYISLGNTLQIIFSKLFGLQLNDNISVNTSAIVMQMRLPRAMLAYLVGFVMSVGGAVAQSVLHNPLASPYTLGVSSGASVGAAVVMLFSISLPFIDGITLTLFGSAFAIATVVLCVFSASKIDKNLSSTTLVLFGMVISLFLNALFTFVAGIDRENFTRLSRWQMGSFSSKGWHSVAVLLIVAVISVAVILLHSKELDIMSFSDEQAASIGVDVKKTKWIMLIITAVMTGVAVSFAGVIGFVDLIAPHIARRLFTPKHRFVTVISGLIGGSFMVLADLISRTILPPSELPVGAVTAFIGAPFFAYVFFSKRGGAKNA